nr:efflux RND transporter periplasmic adaptor subunit [Rhodoligotrophos appendicifer]
MPSSRAASEGPAAPPPPTPVSVALVEMHESMRWDEFSGRLEAIERVEVRSRVAGAVRSVHFSEGELVKQGDRLVTIDPDPYAAEVQRAEAQVTAAKARVALTLRERDRRQKLWDSRTVSQSELDERINAHAEAEANLQAAQASLRSAQLNLSYTEIKAPVAGRVGRLEVTVGNLVAAGPGAPVLTSLLSVSPIYASFDADEPVVMEALRALGPQGRDEIDRIPVEMVTSTSGGPVVRGKLALIDNHVDAASGTIRVRAIFDNPDGGLMPGQFARLRMGQPKPEPSLLVSERAIGTDQDKKFVMLVDQSNKAVYREIHLGSIRDGLRVVNTGLAPGDRIVVNGLQRIRPGSVVAPEVVPMGQPAHSGAQASAADTLTR